MDINREDPSEPPFYYPIKEEDRYKKQRINWRKALFRSVSTVVLLAVFGVALSRIGYGIWRGLKVDAIKKISSTPSEAPSRVASAIPPEVPLLESESEPVLDNARVIRVVDGDMLKVNFRGKPESIRLIGIDTPESRSNKKAIKDAERGNLDIRTIISMGKQATKFVNTLVSAGDTVKIEFDVQARDKYGRLLGYIYLPDGRMLNEEIVKAGYANLMTIPPNVKYQERFLKAYREARENRRGLWKYI